jgi:hypothetical protein
MRQRIAFECNDPIAPAVEIMITANVFGGVSVNPPSLNFGRLGTGMIERRIVEVVDRRRPTNRSTLRVLLQRSSPELSLGSLTNSDTRERIPTDKNDPQKYTFAVAARSPWRRTEVCDRIELTDGAGYSLCSIPVYARSARPIQFYPTEVLLPVSGGDSAWRFEKRCLCVSDAGSFHLTAKVVPKQLSLEIQDLSDTTKIVVIRRSQAGSTIEHFHGVVILAAMVNKQDEQRLEVPVTLLDDTGN